jgi:Ca2+-binding RTX toxin-like protein
MADQDWESLEDTYWYVPTAYLGSFAMSGGTRTPLVDQTLWHITDVVDGYVFGTVRTTLGNGWVESTLVGSITPNGAVSFSFSDGSDLTTGIGRMVEKDGDWYFEMQMTTGTGTANVSHWAYMAQVDEGDSAWTSLPGYTDTGVEAAFDSDSSNDAGASAPQRIVFGTDGADSMDNYTSSTGLLLYAEGGADTLVGTDSADGLVAGKGNDTLSGGAGGDELYGQAGADVLKGQGGADTLSGGRGDDTLTGGDGSDLFVFATGDGVDTIKDFDAKGGGTSQDYIGLGSDVYDALVFVQVGDDAQIRFGTGQIITLVDVDIDDLSEKDFVTADIV